VLLVEAVAIEEAAEASFLAGEVDHPVELPVDVEAWATVWVAVWAEDLHQSGRWEDQEGLHNPLAEEAHLRKDLVSTAAARTTNLMATMPSKP
ncbi:unnamed protein product, partial [Nesidiocoris tenuis]